jgi:hypothetical protein
MAYTFMHPLSMRYQELEGERPLFLQTIVCPFTVETWHIQLTKTEGVLPYISGIRAWRTMAVWSWTGVGWVDGEPALRSTLESPL